jgi:hypothetical protein
MNSENVISLEAVSANLLPYRRVKMTAAGVDYAGAGDLCIGHILPGDLNREYPTIQLTGRYVEAELGNATDIVRGDLLEAAANGTLVKQVSGTVAGVAVSGATEAGDRFEAILTGGEIGGLTGPAIFALANPVTWTATAVAADDLVIPITHRTVNKTTGADAEALTLANGAFLGQKLNILHIVDGGGDGTLTPTTKSNFSTIVFSEKGQSVDLEWTTAGWRITGTNWVTTKPVMTLA